MSAVKTEEVEVKFEELEVGYEVEKDILNMSETRKNRPNGAKSPYYCSACDANFHRISTYTAHMKRWHATATTQPSTVISNKKIYYCNECDKSFVKKINLDRHLQLPFHRIDGTKETNTFYCEVCNKRLARKTYYSRHQKTLSHRQKIMEFHGADNFFQGEENLCFQPVNASNTSSTASQHQ